MMLDEIKIAYLLSLVPVYLYRPLYGISISYLLLFLVSLSAIRLSHIQW